MSTMKNLKSKLIPEDISDFLNESQFLKDSAKTKKPPKRQRADSGEDNFSTIGPKLTNAKNKKMESNFEMCQESRQKLSDVMSRQMESRRHTNDCVLKSLAEVLNTLEADHNALKENEQKLENLTGAFMKCIQQATSAHKQKIKALKEILASFKKESEEMHLEHKAEADRLGSELEKDIKKLQEKLISETKRSGWETLKRTIFQAMQNDF